MNTLQTATFEATQSLAAMDFKTIVENAAPQLEAMVRLYMAQQAQASVTAVKIAGIDAEKQTFLENAGQTKSVRLSAVSSFFTFLERRPAPTATDIESLIKALPPKWAVAVSIMAGRLCVGLARLAIKGRFTTHTKGQDKSGELSPDIVETIKAAGLELRQPFGNLTAELRHVITYEIGKAYKGKVRFLFSPYKLRHFYAVNEYRKTGDIRHVSKLLGHNQALPSRLRRNRLKAIKGAKLWQ